MHSALIFAIDPRSGAIPEYMLFHRLRRSPKQDPFVSIAKAGIESHQQRDADRDDDHDNVQRPADRSRPRMVFNIQVVHNREQYGHQGCKHSQDEDSELGCAKQLLFFDGATI